MDLKEYLRNVLIEPLRRFDSPHQSTILDVATNVLEKLYEDADNFTRLLDPHEIDPDFLRVMARSEGYDWVDEMDTDEQREIIEHIAEIWKRTGSIESIERMYQYYGSQFPENVQVNIPAYQLFRYGISTYSGTDRIKDGHYWRSGVFELFYEGELPYGKLREFVLSTLRPGGSKVFFTKHIPMYSDELSKALHLYGGSADFELTIGSPIVILKSGFIFNQNTPPETRVYSGKRVLWVDLTWNLEYYAHMLRLEEESICIPEGPLTYMASHLFPGVYSLESQLAPVIDTFIQPMVIFYPSGVTNYRSTLLERHTGIAAHYGEEGTSPGIDVHSEVHLLDRDGYPIESIFRGVFVVGVTNIGEYPD